MLLGFKPDRLELGWAGSFGICMLVLEPRFAIRSDADGTSGMKSPQNRAKERDDIQVAIEGFPSPTDSHLRNLWQLLCLLMFRLIFSVTLLNRV